MKLSRKIFVIFIFAIIIPVSIIGYFLSYSRNTKYFESTVKTQLTIIANVIDLIDVKLSEAESNINFLSEDEDVLFEDDSEFTNFVKANPDTFQYNIKEDEQKIIDKFYEFKLTHSNINSIYMGRENGSFVRSHRRASPTAYDPRVRPWYTLALSNPDKVNFTDPYQSVTTDDVNIGVVKTIRDSSEQIMGVIGMDITLQGIKDLLNKTSFAVISELNIVSSDGLFIASNNSDLLYTKVFDTFPEYRKINESKSGNFSFVKNGVKYFGFYDTYEKLNWKFFTIIAEDNIYMTEGTTNFISVILVISSLVLCIISLMFFESFIKKDVKRIVDFSDTIVSSRFNGRIEVNKNDEFSLISRNINSMIDKVEHEFILLENKNEVLNKELRRVNSELNYSNKKLLQKEKQALLGVMTNNVIDEISSPIDSCITGATYLSMISSQFSDELEKSELDRDKLINYSSIIQNNAEIINNNLKKSGSIINRLKSISHSNDTTTKFNIYDTIYNNLINFYPELRSAKIELEIDGDKNVEVINNKNIFNQVIINLIMTTLSSDFLSDEKKARIEYKIENKVLTVVYKDNSKGMDPKIIRKLKADNTVAIYEDDEILFSVFIINTAVISRLNGSFNIVDTNSHGFEFIIEIPV